MVEQTVGPEREVAPAGRVRLLRGVQLGFLAGAVCSCVDVALVAAVGKRIPWTYAPGVAAVYLALGINLSGEKELLGLWIAETE